MVKNWFSPAMLFNKCFLEELLKRRVKTAINYGEVIEEKPDDKPLLSYLILDFVRNKPIPVVFSHDQTSSTGYAVKAYIPDPQLWTDDFRKRR